MRLKTALVVGVIVTASVIGISALYIRSQVKSALKDAVAAIAPLADITYTKVSVTPGGTVRISGIDIRPRIVNDYFTIEEIKVETPGLWFLLTAEKKLSKGTVPERIRVSLQGLTFSLDGGMAYAFDKFIAAAIAARGATPISNCGDTPYFDFKGYRKLGYEQFIADVSFGYEFRKRERRMDVMSEWRMRDIGAAAVKFEFSGVSSDARELVTNKPRMRTFTVTYDDLSFVDRMKKFCSQATGVSVEQYVDAEINRSDASYQVQWGFIPGAGLRAAYRDFITTPGTIRIQGSPPEEMDMEALRLFKAEDAIAMLDLQISVNNVPVTDLSVMETAATDIPVNADPEQPALDALSTPAPVAQTPVPVPEKNTSADERRSIPTGELKRHIGREVRLTLASGAVREGALLQIRDGFARIERRYAGGATTIAIPINEIVAAEEGRTPGANMAPSH